LVDPIEFGRRVQPEEGDEPVAGATGKTLTIRDGFERVLFLAPGASLPALTGAAGPSLEAAFAKHREKFRLVQLPPLSHLFAEQALDEPGSPVAAAQVEGGKEDLVYVFDPLESRSESLRSLHRGEGTESAVRALLFTTVLSDQPVGRDRRDPIAPRYFLTDVDLTLSASAGKDAAMSVLETVMPEGRKQRVFRFGLTSSVFVSVGPNALESRSFRLRKVSDESGRALLFDHRFGEVAVEWRRPSSRSTRRRSGSRSRVTSRASRRRQFLGARPRGGDWFPQPGLNGQFFTWHCTVKVKKPFVPFRLRPDGRPPLRGGTRTPSRRGGTSPCSSPRSSPASTRSGRRRGRG
jgi:hypothetical protein